MINYNQYGMRSAKITAATRMGGAEAARATAQDRLMPRDLATWSPLHCLVTAFDKPEQAQQAVEALRKVGFLDTDIRLVHPREIMALDEASHARSLLARIVASVRSIGSESITIDEYVNEARCGHHVLIVYAPGEVRMRHAAGIVACHRAHTLHYFGRWVIRGLHD